jgi:1-aminocyclopropane-1-carboxylate deaminase/D-cysteine desulfhydrase-like pyridoxal-dependent ACC family enzyme
MELVFISRETFDKTTVDLLQKQYPAHQVIEQGGYGRLGMRGAAEILNLNGTDQFDFVVAASGSGTMGAGLISNARSHQRVILMSVLKNNFSILDEINALLESIEKTKPAYDMFFDFHLGGYAKKNSDLFDKMNSFYNTHQIPTDFVYTGKLIYGFYQLMKASFFPKKSKILLIHSGGLQGNRSLTKNELIY